MAGHSILKPCSTCSLLKQVERGDQRIGTLSKAIDLNVAEIAKTMRSPALHIVSPSLIIKQNLVELDWSYPL